MIAFSLLFYFSSVLIEKGKKIYEFININGFCSLTFNQWVYAFGWTVKTALTIISLQFFYSLYEETIQSLIKKTLVKKAKEKYWDEI